MITIAISCPINELNYEIRDFNNTPSHYDKLAISSATPVVRFMWDTYNDM